MLDSIAMPTVPMMTQKGGKEKIIQIVKVFNSFSEAELFGTLIKNVNLYILEKFNTECMLIKKSLDNGGFHYMVEYKNLEKIIVKIDFFIKTKIVEQFDEGRDLKKHFSIEFNKIEKTLNICSKMSESFDYLSLSANMAEELLKKLKRYLSDQRATQIFFIQCRGQCQSLMNKIPEKSLLKEKLTDLLNFVNLHISEKLNLVFE